MVLDIPPDFQPLTPHERIGLGIIATALRLLDVGVGEETLRQVRGEVVLVPKLAVEPRLV